MNHGVVNHGVVNHGVVNHGVVNHGVVNHGVVNHGVRVKGDATVFPVRENGSVPFYSDPIGPIDPIGLQRFIESKNSALFLVTLSLSIRNSIAASSSIGCSSLRRIHIFCSSSGSVSSSSRRVPERLRLIAG